MYEFLSSMGTLVWLNTTAVHWDLLLQSGRGVMGRLTRPLHVPYSFGLPYSYTIPSGTRPTSSAI